MSKLIQALLTGMFFTFFLDFFIFLGIKLNYINFYEIKVYYNILFADHQSLLIFATFSIVLGYMSVYAKNYKYALVSISILLALSISTMIPSIGYSVGEMLLMKKDVILNDKNHSYRGDVYYDGRNVITFYDYELDKIIFLKKELMK